MRLFEITPEFKLEELVSVFASQFLRPLRPWND